MQALYAYESKGHVSSAAAEKKMLENFQHIEDLHIYQLSFLTEVFELAHRKLEEGKNKLLPRPEDLKADNRFANNQVIQIIQNNKSFQKACNRLHINWHDNYGLVRKALETIKESSYFHKFMQEEEPDFEDQKQLIKKIITQFLSDYTLLKNMYEEQNIYWDEDYYVVNRMLLETVNSIKKTSNEDFVLPGVFNDRDEQGNSEDLEFARSLLRKTAMNAESFRSSIIEKAKNWEYDRIAKVDMILLKMAMSELSFFPYIPVKVTINEYIDISKYYSTPKSRVFINGVLDNIILEMKNKDAIKKVGRGLKES